MTLTAHADLDFAILYILKPSEFTPHNTSPRLNENSGTDLVRVALVTEGVAVEVLEEASVEGVDSVLLVVSEAQTIGGYW